MLRREKEEAVERCEVKGRGGERERERTHILLHIMPAPVGHPVGQHLLAALEVDKHRPDVVLLLIPSQTVGQTVERSRGNTCEVKSRSRISSAQEGEEGGKKRKGEREKGERTLSPLNLTVDLLQTRSGDDAPGRVDVNLLDRMAEELLELLSPTPKKPSSSVSKLLSLFLSLKCPFCKPAISRPTSVQERGRDLPRESDPHLPKASHFPSWQCWPRNATCPRRRRGFRNAGRFLFRRSIYHYAHERGTASACGSRADLREGEEGLTSRRLPEGRKKITYRKSSRSVKGLRLRALDRERGRRRDGPSRR